MMLKCFLTTFFNSTNLHHKRHFRNSKMNKYLSKVEKYNSDKPELLIINAIIAANNKTKPLAASSLKNQIKGLDK